MTVHRLHRQQGVRPMPNLVSLTRDYGSAHIIDLDQHRVSREYIRQCEAIDIAERLDGPPRHVRIEPRIDWLDLTAKAIIIAGLGAAVAMWCAA